MNNVVSITQAKRILHKLVTSIGPTARILLQGAPGTAKSSIVKQLCEQIGYTLCDVRLAQKAPEDITGYPHIVDGVMHYSRPHWFPTQPKTVLFLDELGHAPIAVQNVALQLLLDRCVGPHVLPDDCIVIGATNHPENRAGSNALTTAVQSRFTTTITVEPEKAEWLDWAKANNVNAYVTAHTESMLESVLQFNPREKGGFVCPRTLEYAGQIVSAYDNDANNPDMKACLHGEIGDAAASNFLAWLETVASLPDYNDIVSDPETVDVNIGMSEPIGKIIANNVKFAHVPKVLRYIKRFPSEQVMAIFTMMPDAIKAHPDMVELEKTLN